MDGLELLEPTEFYNVLNQEMKYPMLSDQTYLLLFDIRKLDQYMESHIITAKLVQYNEDGTFKMPIDAELETKRNVVIYDDKSSSLSLPDTKALTFARFLWESGSKYPVKVIKGGYEKFSALYPFLRTQEMLYTPQQLENMFTYPVEIVPGFLYVGTHEKSQNGRVNKDLKIKAHVNVSKKDDAYFSGKPEIQGMKNKLVSVYLQVPVDDEKGEDLLSSFGKISNFIDSHDTRDGKAVLISSELGISRSVAAALAYMMHRDRCSLQIAWNQMKLSKKNMCPNRSFVEQLMSWEQQVLGEKVTEINMIEP